MPDHSTFARFRTGRCREAVEDLFYQYVRLLEKLGETDHQTVFVDGTKLESRAGRYTFCWRKNVEKQLAKVKQQVYGQTGLKRLSSLKKRLEKQKAEIVFVQGSGHRKSEAQKHWEMLDALRQPLFMAYHNNQPFNNNHLRPCPMLENPEKLQQMVHETGAKSTDLQSPETVEHLCGKCEHYAKEWKTKADELWGEK